MMFGPFVSYVASRFIEKTNKSKNTGNNPVTSKLSVRNSHTQNTSPAHWEDIANISSLTESASNRPQQIKDLKEFCNEMKKTKFEKLSLEYRDTDSIIKSNGRRPRLLTLNPVDNFTGPQEAKELGSKISLSYEKVSVILSEIRCLNNHSSQQEIDTAISHVHDLAKCISDIESTSDKNTTQKIPVEISDATRKAKELTTKFTASHINQSEKYTKKNNDGADIDLNNSKETQSQNLTASNEVGQNPLQNEALAPVVANAKSEGKEESQDLCEMVDENACVEGMKFLCESYNLLVKQVNQIGKQIGGETKIGEVVEVKKEDQHLFHLLQFVEQCKKFITNCNAQLVVAACQTIKLAAKEIQLKIENDAEGKLIVNLLGGVITACDENLKRLNTTSEKEEKAPAETTNEPSVTDQKPGLSARDAQKNESEFEQLTAYTPEIPNDFLDGAGKNTSGNEGKEEINDLVDIMEGTRNQQNDVEKDGKKEIEDAPSITLAAPQNTQNPTLEQLITSQNDFRKEIEGCINLCKNKIATKQNKTNEITKIDLYSKAIKQLTAFHDSLLKIAEFYNEKDAAGFSLELALAAPGMAKVAEFIHASGTLLVAKEEKEVGEQIQVIGLKALNMHDENLNIFRKNNAANQNDAAHKEIEDRLLSVKNRVNVLNKNYITKNDLLVKKESEKKIGPVRKWKVAAYDPKSSFRSNNLRGIQNNKPQPKMN